ncbi:sulfatase-like hydrolase/transferase [Salinarchaeum sp. Harcht-Bsk1]|uniref:sulfatase-like hydrolase/transferase n=1 Tax=Salinarchaeum sp. Harcht-Bsk1 TaxID=1333523 RepID=UPI0006776606|nr:sulfatase-like hydrolase/transferase [Salinarchaeum sp. Harcht-Bsk1]
MNVKRRLVAALPPTVKRLLARPYDLVQTKRANRTFRARDRPSIDPDPDAPQHVVLLVVDALRSDVVTEETMPFLASMDGTTSALTPSPWTFPAVSSMLTGAYPHEHGAIRAPNVADEGFVLPERIPDDRLTLSDYFAAAGYHTYGGFGHDTPFVALSGRFATHDLSHQLDASAADVLADHEQWITDRSNSPTFSYVHLADPHIPVTPPNEYWQKYDVDSSIENLENWEYERTLEPDEAAERYREHRWRLYRAAAEYVDDCISAHIESIRSILDDVTIVVTADHGELLWDHVALDQEQFFGDGCVDHGGTPYEALARVPLLSDELPTAPNDGSPASLIDLAPTLLSSIGVDAPEGTSGLDLHADDHNPRSLLVEGCLGPEERKAVYSDGDKLIASESGTTLTFDLPDETPVEFDSASTETLRSKLPPWPDSDIGSTNVSGVVENRLDALGYK